MRLYERLRLFNFQAAAFYFKKENIIEIVIKQKAIQLDGISNELGADVRGMVALLFSEALRTWEQGFKMNLNSDCIQKTINSCTAKIVIRVETGKTKAEMLDVFMDKYADLQDAIFEDAPRGCGLALAWPVVDDAGQLSVQAIALINPYQVDAFDEHAFGETAQKLGLVVSYYDEDAEAKPMDRWVEAATSILKQSNGGADEEFIRIVSTESTLFLGNGRRARNTPRQAAVEPVAA